MKKFTCLFIASVFMLLGIVGCNNPPSGTSLNSFPVATATPSPVATPTPSAIASGWHLIETKYMVPDRDLDVNGGPLVSTMSGSSARLFDYYQDSGKQGDIILTHYRTDEGGKVLASCKWEILWVVPPSYLPANQKVSIDVEHKVLGSLVWSPPVLSATYDSPGQLPGYRTSSANVFHQPNGSQGTYRDTREEVYSAKATMTTEYPINGGKVGATMAINIHFGENYGVRYTYEWK